MRRLFLEPLEDRRLLAFDFGDAPTSYGTLLADNGARHEATGPSLSQYRDSEVDGQPNTTATGDDIGGVIGDHGVAFASPLLRGQLADYTVSVWNGPGPVKLDAWVDFDGNGTFDDAGGERITAPGGTVLTYDSYVNFGIHLQFFIPLDAASHTFARFRLSTAGNLGPTGPAADGEVEDYALIIRRPLDGATSIQAVSDAPAGTSFSWDGLPGHSTISDDGNLVVFVSNANNVIEGQVDDNASDDVFLYNRTTGTTTLVSRIAASHLVAGNGRSYYPVISGDGRFISFTSAATDLLGGQIFGYAIGFGLSEVYLYEVATGQSTLISHAIGTGNQATTGNKPSNLPAISQDGKFVTYYSWATNLVTSQIDLNGHADVFRYERGGPTILVSGTDATTMQDSD